MASQNFAVGRDAVDGPDVYLATRGRRPMRARGTSWTVATACFVVTIAGCGGNDGATTGSFQRHASTTARKPLGANTIVSGCDLDQARATLRQRVLDEQWFKAYGVAGLDGSYISTYVTAGTTTILAAIVLRCGSKITYAGVDKPLKATADNAYDPVRFISGDATVHDENNQTGGTKNSLRRLRFVHAYYADYPADKRPGLAAGFADSEDADKHFGIAVVKGDPELVFP